MSRHLTTCAAALDVEPVRLKLLLLCLAESGRDKDRVALPGRDQMLKWTGVGRSQLYNLLDDLVELQLIARHKSSRPRQRAEYVVFPNGCCEVHGKRPAGAVVDDGADVVSIDAAEAVVAGSGRSWKFATDDDAGLSTGSDPALDPLQNNGSTLDGEWVHSTGPMGPLQGPKWVHSPRSDRALSKSPLQDPTSTEPLHGGSDPTQLTSRATPATETPVGATLTTAAALRADGCDHCDNGWLHDRDGLPSAPCLRCELGRQRARETA